MSAALAFVLLAVGLALVVGGVELLAGLGPALIVLGVIVSASALLLVNVDDGKGSE